MGGYGSTVYQLLTATPSVVTSSPLISQVLFGFSQKCYISGNSSADHEPNMDWTWIAILKYRIFMYFNSRLLVFADHPVRVLVGAIRLNSSLGIQRLLLSVSRAASFPSKIFIRPGTTFRETCMFNKSSFNFFISNLEPITSSPNLFALFSMQKTFLFLIHPPPQTIMNYLLHSAPSQQPLTHYLILYSFKECSTR